MAETRPPNQRWIKRPPRPSRVGPPPPAFRVRPGWSQFLMASGFGTAAGILGGVVGPSLVPRPGMAGLFAGIGFVVGFITLWRAFGGTRQDVRDLFK